MPNKYKYFPQNKDELIKLVSNKKIKLSNIDISRVNDFSELFSKSQRTDFSGIENWNVSHVTNMSKMFKRAVYFNSDLNNWNVSNVENMEGMFEGTVYFNDDLNSWDTSKVKNMKGMFSKSKFNGDISTWNTSNVDNMFQMFADNTEFNGDISSWDISKVKNMQYMFAYTDDISKKQVNNWKVSNDVKYYGMFRGTELEKNPPEWFRLKNEFEIKYYPESKEELIRMLNDENILAGEIDVSKIDNVTEALDNIKRYNKSYLQEYHRLLSIKKGIDMEISKEWFVGNSYSISSNQYIQSLEDISSEYHDKLIDISMQPFYEKLENPKKLIHDDYPGIEFWNVPNLYELLNKIYE